MDTMDTKLLHESWKFVYHKQRALVNFKYGFYVCSSVFLEHIN